MFGTVLGGEIPPRLDRHLPLNASITTVQSLPLVSKIPRMTRVESPETEMRHGADSGPVLGWCLEAFQLGGALKTFLLQYT